MQLDETDWMAVKIDKGGALAVDVSETSCTTFGFVSGQRVINKTTGNMAIVLGTGLSEPHLVSSNTGLWIRPIESQSASVYTYPSTIFSPTNSPN